MKGTALLFACAALLSPSSMASAAAVPNSGPTQHIGSSMIDEMQVSRRASDDISVTQGNDFTLVVDKGATAQWDTQFVRFESVADAAQRTYTFNAVQAGDTQISVTGAEQKTVIVRIKLPDPSRSVRSRRALSNPISTRADGDISVAQGESFNFAVKSGAAAQWDSQFIQLQSVADGSQRMYAFKAVMAGDTQISVSGSEARTVIVRIKLPKPSRS